MKTIYLAGGCFWGVEEYFSRINGVLATEVAYANGKTEDPTYEKVCTGITAFVETVKIDYDPDVISLDEILVYFFKIIDPTLLNRQGADIGSQYRTGIYYVDKEDLASVDAYIESIRDNYSRPIVTEVMPLKNYYRAEEYHQSYLKKNPGGYCHIDLSSK